MTPSPATLAQLEAVALDPVRPLLAVDVDEVIVSLAAHLAEYAQGAGYRLRLTGYRLDGALTMADGSPAPDDALPNLFKGFFATETRRQRAYPGAAEALAEIAERSQVLILTNVPVARREDRVENLAGQGIAYPLVANEGPKGPALQWLSERIAAPLAFVDDSPTQLASAARHAPRVSRIHYVGDPDLRGFLRDVEHAQHAPADWPGIAETVAGLFRLPA